MNTTPFTRSIVIRNPEGLHARPAEMFARTAMQHEARIEVICDNQRVDAKSILHLLTLGAKQGTQLQLEAQGPDAQQAIETLAALVENGFGAEEEACRQEQAE